MYTDFIFYIFLFIQLLYSYPGSEVPLQRKRRKGPSLARPGDGFFKFGAPGFGFGTSDPGYCTVKE